MSCFRFCFCYHRGKRHLDADEQNSRDDSGIPLCFCYNDRRGYLFRRYAQMQTEGKEGTMQES